MKLLRKLILPASFFAVIAIWLVPFYLFFNNPNRDKITIGDQYGAVNSLFSGLAFAGLIYTIILQKNELTLQRKELELTRDELRGQKETLQAQNNQLAHQAFESTFFQMAKLHIELLNSIEIVERHIVGDPAHTIKGASCFFHAWNSYRESFTARAEKENVEVRRQQIAAAYASFWEAHETKFGHYFLSLYNIIKFIHNSNALDKKFYTNIVRAQLSGQELLIIFYDGIYNTESKFTPLIEEYSLLKHLPAHAITTNLDFNFYKKSAFGGEYPAAI